ncbi:hypothetical protein C8R45DRAFT_1091435 [Mycena sanguinolenta]|nr:hypothetical protein C8R45DRAFT_1091435 [Mycena sanguinolenta]
MPPGRPRLAPEVKQEHVTQSRKKYEEKNAEKRRNDARLRMRRKRAAIESSDPTTQRQYRRKAAEASERYRDRVRAKAWAAAQAARGSRRRAQRAEADDLRRKHQAVAESQSRSDTIRKTSSDVKKKVKRLTPPKEPLQLSSPFQDPSSPSPLPRLRRASSPLPRSLRDIQNQADDNSSDSEFDTRRPPEAPIFEQRVINNIPRCPHCHELGCPSCACMCEETSVWIFHAGGHFFPTCTKCGGDDCPGCACICKNSTTFVQHGGHNY